MMAARDQDVVGRFRSSSGIIGGRGRGDGVRSGCGADLPYRRCGATAGPVLRYMFGEGLHELRLSPDGPGGGDHVDPQTKMGIGLTADDHGDGWKWRGTGSGAGGDLSGLERRTGSTWCHMRPSGVEREGGHSRRSSGCFRGRRCGDPMGSCWRRAAKDAPEDLAGLLFDTQLRKVPWRRMGGFIFVSWRRCRCR